MKSLLAALAICLAAFSSADAKVLAYRVRFASGTDTHDGVTETRKPWASTLSLLIFLDLDTDYVEEIRADGTATELIMLDDKKKSFTHYFDGDGDNDGATHRSYTKFSFFNNAKNFYFFNEDFEKSGTTIDHGSMVATGACTASVDVGWVNSATGAKELSAVPKNFTVTQSRGDGRRFKKFVWNLAYDATITKAVNAYLSTQNVKSVAGEGVSLSIPSAKAWLTSNYLRKTHPNTWQSPQ